MTWWFSFDLMWNVSGWYTLCLFFNHKLSERDISKSFAELQWKHSASKLQLPLCQMKNFMLKTAMFVCWPLLSSRWFTAARKKALFAINSHSLKAATSGRGMWSSSSIWQTFIPTKSTKRTLILPVNNTASAWLLLFFFKRLKLRCGPRRHPNSGTFPKPGRLARRFDRLESLPAGGGQVGIPSELWSFAADWV